MGTLELLHRLQSKHEELELVVQNHKQKEQDHQLALKCIQGALTNLYVDMELLKSGQWVPDKDSAEASQDNVLYIAEKLGLDLTTTELQEKEK
ncbi:MAG: hypothetical protein GQ570_03725 [Helicobacteraceae bacterium]|nr:hypothetical protein [Helicobacteraceae bacterium]